MATSIPAAGLFLDHAASLPRSHQYADRPRAQILAGQLRPRFRLPSTRALVTERGGAPRERRPRHRLRRRTPPPRRTDTRLRPVDEFVIADGVKHLAEVLRPLVR